MAEKVLNTRLLGVKVLYWINGAFGTIATGLLGLILQSSYSGQFAFGELTNTVKTFEGTVIEFKEIMKEYRLDSVEIRQLAERNKLQVEVLSDRCMSIDEDIDILSRRFMEHEAKEK